jgi:two-component system sensor histidine kinase YesM
VYSSQIGSNGWLTIGMIPQEQLTRDMKSITTFIIILIVAVCMVVALVALYFTGKVTKPITQMMRLMRQVETGDFNVNMEIASKDELGKLSESFNVMVKKLDNSMKMLFENQRKLRKAELRALEAQINPHFLYNTLDSVCWLARTERNDEIINTVVALTKLLRIGLSHGDEIITIGNEVEHVNNYLIIQKMRYRRKFDYRIEVPEDIKDYKILKLILQPLAENALYHGIKNKPERGTITIHAEKNTNSIEFRVADTGIGMSQKQIQELESGLADKDSAKAEGVGLKNVDERMKIYFGEQYGLSFQSKQGVGTVVTFKIPIVTGE